MFIAIIIGLYFFAVIFDFIPIIKDGKKQEYLSYLAFLTISFTVLILYGLNIKVSGPTDLIINTIQELFDV